MYMEDEERKKRYLRMFQQQSGGAMPEEIEGASGNNPGVPALALRQKYSGMFGGGSNSDVMSNVQPYNPDGGNDPGFERQGYPHNDPGFERKGYPHNDPGFMRGGNDASNPNPNIYNPNPNMGLPSDGNGNLQPTDPIGEPPPLYRPIPEGASTGRSDMPMETGFGTPPPPEEPLGNPPPLPTATERTQSEIERLRNSRPREHSFGKRLGMGALSGLAEWSRAGGPGGLIGGLSSIGTGAAIFAASPGAEGEYRKAQKMQGLFGQLGQQQAVEAHQSQMAKPVLDALENERDRVAKSQLETQKFQEKLAADTRDFNQKMAYLKASQGDQYETEINPKTGQAMLRNKLDSTKVIPATDPDGNPIYEPRYSTYSDAIGGTVEGLTPKDVVNLDVGNVNRATNVAEGNRAAMQRWETQNQSHNDKISEGESNILKWQKEYDAYIMEGSSPNPTKRVKQTDSQGVEYEVEVADLEYVKKRNREMKALEGKIKAEEARVAKLKNNPPQKPADVQTTNVGGTLKGQKVSLDAARKLAKSQGRNMTDEQLIQEIKSQGGVVY